MIFVALFFFFAAVLLGFVLLCYLLLNKNIPKGLILIHGSLAATGLILLIIYLLFFYQQPYVSAILFAIAAIFGMYLFYRDITQKKVFKSLVIFHAILGLIGLFILVLYSYYSF